MPKTVGELLAADLPVRDDDSESDLIALVDIVVTGVETGWLHFTVEDYDPDADGEIVPWAVINALPDAGQDGSFAILNATNVRSAVKDYVDSRIDGGMALEEARKLMDGSYTDAVIADSILQFALYGEEIYS